MRYIMIKPELAVIVENEKVVGARVPDTSTTYRVINNTDVARPGFVIVVEGGCVVSVGVTGHDVTYRIIDLDVTKTGDSDSAPVHDYVPDAENIDIEEYTRQILEDV
jgi:hypothetical protein